MQEQEATIEVVENCVIARGKELSSSSIEDFGRKYGLTGRLIWSGLHAKRLGAICVIGNSESLQRLTELHLPAVESVQKNVADAKSMGLSEQAQNWLDGYQRIAAAETIFGVTTGMSLLKMSSANVPETAENLAYCLRLIKEVPEVQEGLHHLKDLGGPWSILCAALPALEAQLESEFPHWKSIYRFNAAQTNKTLRSLLRASGHEPETDEDEIFEGTVTAIETLGEENGGGLIISVDGVRYLCDEAVDDALQKVLAIGTIVKYTLMDRLFALNGISQRITVVAHTPHAAVQTGLAF